MPKEDGASEKRKAGERQEAGCPDLIATLDGKGWVSRKRGDWEKPHLK